MKGSNKNYGLSRSGVVTLIFIVIFVITACVETFYPNKSAPDFVIILQVVAIVSMAANWYSQLNFTIWQYTAICLIITDIIRCVCLLIC